MHVVMCFGNKVRRTGINGSGFWLFTRSVTPSAATIDAMHAAATKLGFTLSRLQKVKQGADECNNYNGLFKKE